MKRCLTLICLLCVLCTGLFSVSVSADNAASKVELYCTVNQDGDCLVSMTVALHMESDSKDLTFPLPEKAQDIKLNGGTVIVSKGDHALLAQVGAALGGIVGDIPIRFDYTIPKTVAVNADKKLQMDLPLLCGFSYSIANMSFIITLPSDMTNEPVFHSTYQQIGFDSSLELILSGNMITGSSNCVLNDHEAVSMTMIVPEEMFPNVSTYQREGNPELVPMGFCAALALLYWLIFLRTLPAPYARSTTPPAGVTAGELGCRLTMTGADLNMLVLSWAQMGYLHIQVDKGRVRLYKRMDMGNERSLFEVRVFQSLFGNRRVVECVSPQYAHMCRKTASMLPGERAICKPGYNNRNFFRAFLCIGQIFCGVCMAMNITGQPVAEAALSILFGIFAVFSAWKMQAMAYCIYLRKKADIWIGLVCMLCWIGIGAWAKQILIPLGAVAVQLLAGFLSAYGGRRTDVNRTEMSEIIGLRRYLKYLPVPEAERLYQLDHEVFFRLAPYAIAMGVAAPFAAAFGDLKLAPCPYFVTRVQGKRTAREWMRMMQQTVSIMDSGYRRLEFEKWMAVRIRTH